jgi:hypothetical protein
MYLLRHFRATIFAVDKAVNVTYYKCVSNLIYPACNGHAPYCTVIGGLSGSATYVQTSVILPSEINTIIQICVFGFYSILLHVSAVHIGRHRAGCWFTKRLKGEKPFLANSGCKVIIK